LAELNLKNNPTLTEAAVQKLSAVLPKCKIVWDGGTVEPTKKP
jgi:hypothetical protein